MRPLDAPARRALLGLAVLAAIGAVQVLFLIGVEIDRSLRHRAAIAELRADVAVLHAEAEDLRAIAERADDAAFREQLARRQGFVGPDETRVIVVHRDSP